MRTLWYFQIFFFFNFDPEKVKKRASNVAHNRPNPFFPTVQNWFFISWNLGTRHLFSYLCTTDYRYINYKRPRICQKRFILCGLSVGKYLKYVLDMFFVEGTSLPESPHLSDQYGPLFHLMEWKFYVFVESVVAKLHEPTA